MGWYNVTVLNSLLTYTFPFYISFSLSFSLSYSTRMDNLHSLLVLHWKTGCEGGLVRGSWEVILSGFYRHYCAVKFQQFSLVLGFFYLTHPQHTPTPTPTPTQTPTHTRARATV